MDGKLLCMLLVVFISSCSYGVTRHHGARPKMSSTRWHNFNNCEIPITNWGEFGYMYGYWPTGSGEHYIYGAGLWVGAMKNGDALVSCGYSTIGAGSDWMPGPPEHNYDHSIDLSSHPEDRVYLSTNSIDREEWPLREVLGLSGIVSGQDGWTEFNDLWEPQHQWERGTYPLGLWVEQHSFCWRVPTLLEDMLFILYEMENVSADTIREMYVGIGADMDVGWWDDDLVGYDIDLGIGYTYGLQQEPGWSSGSPYYVGVAVAQGPRASDTVYVRDYPWNADYPYAIRDTVLPDSQLVLTSLARWSGWFSMDDKRRYLTLAGYDWVFLEYDPWPERDLLPDDKRMVLGCGPFELHAGEVDTFLVAVMFSNGSTGGLHRLLNQAAIAKSIARTMTREPLLQILSPNGGEELSSMHRIVWETLEEDLDRIDLYLSSDSGWTWSELAADLENTGTYLWNTQSSADGSYLLKVCGYDSLFFTWDLSDGEFTVANLRMESFLVRIFPNPFSHSAVITYCIPWQTGVTLTIYDGAGRRVKQMVEGIREPGIHDVVWYGTDESGRKVPSGTYFLRLAVRPVHTDLAVGEVEGYTATRKLCVVR